MLAARTAMLAGLSLLPPSLSRAVGQLRANIVFAAVSVAQAAIAMIIGTRRSRHAQTRTS
jgi:hypothetical protein